MMDASEIITVDTAIAALQKLSARDRLRVIAQVLPETERELAQEDREPRRSLKGLWKGISISEEDIDEARREMWGNFPRDDIV